MSSLPELSKTSSAMTMPENAEAHALGSSTLSVLVVRGLIEAAEQAGISRSSLLRAVQLSPEQLDASELRVPRCSVAALCEAALDLTGDPALGLHWSERLSETTFAPISHLVWHAPSLKEALASLKHFYRLLSDEASYEVVEDELMVTVRCVRLFSELPRVQRLAAEMMVAGFARLVRCFSPQTRPQHVSFEYPAPPYRAEYTRVFDRLERFEQPFTGIVFDRSLLELPAPHKDVDVHDALQALAERRLLRITHRTPYALRVRELLVQEGWRRRSDMSAVARALGMSVRSLRRRLESEGKSYQVVANEALTIAATRLLWEKQLTIQQTAYEMGFADTSAFHRAFKRWTGVTPSAYREAQLNRAEYEQSRRAR